MKNIKHRSLATVKENYTLLNNKKGITLVALIVTIIILLILAGISIASLTGNGLFEKAKLAKEKQENAEINEKEKIDNMTDEIDTVLGSRDGLTESEIRKIVRDEINKNADNSGNKEVIWSTTETGTREIDFNTLNKNIGDYDLLIVYYKTVNSSGEITFDTSETAQYITNYTHTSYYVLGYIKSDLENNKITMTVSANDSTWGGTAQTYLTKVVGIKL